jgi:hypothetical protein
LGIGFIATVTTSPVVSYIYYIMGGVYRGLTFVGWVGWEKKPRGVGLRDNLVGVSAFVLNFALEEAR